MKATILCISDSDKHFRTAIEEYCKRLGRDVQIVEISPVKGDNPLLIIKKETDELLALLQKKHTDAYRVLLSKDGQPLSTMDIVTMIGNIGQEVIFCIGGPYGLDEARLASIIHKKICFGAITMPHGLAKLVLLEQLYRVSMLEQGRKYHY